MVGRSQSPVLPPWPVVNDLLTLPLAERRKLIDQRIEAFLADGDPGFDAEAVLDA